MNKPKRAEGVTGRLCLERWMIGSRTCAGANVGCSYQTDDVRTGERYGMISHAKPTHDSARIIQ
jgi:hypothetical protein